MKAGAVSLGVRDEGGESVRERGRKKEQESNFRSLKAAWICVAQS